jgi:hypothetical protein
LLPLSPLRLPDSRVTFSLPPSLPPSNTCALSCLPSTPRRLGNLLGTRLGIGTVHKERSRDDWEGRVVGHLGRRVGRMKTGTLGRNWPKAWEGQRDQARPGSGWRETRASTVGAPLRDSPGASRAEARRVGGWDSPGRAGQL